MLHGLYICTLSNKKCGLGVAKLMEVKANIDLLLYFSTYVGHELCHGLIVPQIMLYKEVSSPTREGIGI